MPATGTWAKQLFQNKNVKSFKWHVCACVRVCVTNYISFTFIICPFFRHKFQFIHFTYSYFVFIPFNCCNLRALCWDCVRLFAFSKIVSIWSWGFVSRTVSSFWVNLVDAKSIASHLNYFIETFTHNEIKRRQYVSSVLISFRQCVFTITTAWYRWY